MKEDSTHSELIHLTTMKLSGEISPDEISRLEELLAQNDENKKVHEELAKTWEGVEKAEGITQAETDEEWIRLQNAIRSSDQKGTSFPFLRIAASIALFIGIGLVIFFSSRNSETTILAQQIQTEVLTDGSSVTLNASAELSYAPSYGQQSREVTLTGEAYFDVERDEQKTFIIHTPTIDIRVLGTSFTVNAMENKPTVEVVVVTGSVEVNNGDESIVLEVGEKGIFNKQSRQLFKVFNNDVNFMSWRTKKFTFNDVPLENVVELLNSAYQSKLYLSNTDVSNCPVTVSFENQSLASILEVLKVTLDLTTKETSRGTEISGRGC